LLEVQQQKRRRRQLHKLRGLMRYHSFPISAYSITIKDRTEIRDVHEIWTFAPITAVRTEGQGLLRWKSSSYTGSRFSPCIRAVTANSSATASLRWASEARSSKLKAQSSTMRNYFRDAHGPAHNLTEQSVPVCACPVGKNDRTGVRLWQKHYFLMI